MTNLKLEAGAGNTFSGVAETAKHISSTRHLVVEFDFNGILCIVNKDTNLDFLWRDYSNAWTMEWKTVGPDCVENYDATTLAELSSRKTAKEEKNRVRQQEQDKNDANEKSMVDGLTKNISMSIIPGKEKDYEEYVAKNSNDGYSRCVVDYAEYWAKLMQVEIIKGNPVAEIANDTSKHLSFLGITGFMYGCVVSALANFWVHGEELRKWHNKTYGVKEDKGGVVNPAILTIG